MGLCAADFSGGSFHQIPGSPRSNSGSDDSSTGRLQLTGQIFDIPGFSYSVLCIIDGALPVPSVLHTGL